MMNKLNQNHVIESYRDTFRQFGNSAEALQWSTEGQRFRFDKLLEIAASSTGESLQGKRLLEIGCGLGHLYPLLHASFGEVDYTGIDIVPELIEHAQAAYPDATFECRDIFQSPLAQEFDYVLISGLFNAPWRDDSEEFMMAMITHAYAACRIGLVFNFTSSYVNFVSEGTNYFDPNWVLCEILANLSKKVVMHHHYQNCDVAVAVGR
jgi:SAM-dependent methyltransferase